MQYALPVVLVAGALGLTLLLAPLLERSTLVLFMAAVVASALIGGLRAGLLAVVLSIAATLFVVEPAAGGRLRAADTLLRLATFVVASLWIGIVSERTRRFSRQIDDRAEALRRSEESYRRIVDLADEGIWSLDREGRTTYVNWRLARMLGFSADQMQGQSFVGFAIHEQQEQARDLWARVRHGHTVRGDLGLRRRDGETVWVRAACTPRLDGGVFDGAVAMLTDVSAQKHDRETVQQSESLLRAVIDGIADAVFVKDRAGRYLLINPAGAQALGRAPSEIVGKTDRDLMAAAAADAIAEHERTILEHGADETFEYILGDGPTARSFLATGAPHRDAHGRVIGLLAIARDVTDGKRQEREKAALFEQAERARQDAESANRAKDEFLATLSHELRTPLTSIVGWAKMLRSGQLDADSAARAIETIDRNARLQTQLIGDVLDLSRIVSGKLRLDPRPMDLAPVVEAALDTVRPAAEAKGLTLRRAIEPYPCTVSGDPDRLQQVVWNLLSNAIKFTPRGGTVEVGLSCQGAEAEISVADTGIGIGADLLPHVFERFRQGDASSTRSYGGLGLGLAIVRHVVELHGGRAEAESGGAGRGSTFRARLPLLQPAFGRTEPDIERRARDDGEPAAPIPALRGLKVLMVDDEPDAREMVGAILGHAGAQVLLASSAPEAIEMLDRHHPDVLLSDVEMPQESGYGLIRRIRKRPAARGGRIPAAAITAYARLEDRTRALAAGFQMHVAKPLNPVELVTIVASLAGTLQNNEMTLIRQN
jgi:PAS domain S-box-containing protein